MKITDEAMSKQKEKWQGMNENYNKLEESITRNVRTTNLLFIEKAEQD